MANFKQIVAMCLDGASYAQITHALGCSRREVSRAKKIIAEESLSLETFRQLPPGWFDERFSDGRSKRYTTQRDATKTSSSPQSKKPTHNGNNATLPKPSPKQNSDTPMRAWPKSPRLNNVASTCAS